MLGLLRAESSSSSPERRGRGRRKAREGDRSEEVEQSFSAHSFKKAAVERNGGEELEVEVEVERVFGDVAFRIKQAIETLCFFLFNQFSLSGEAQRG